jgi:predicted DNA-binding protein (MmcQ/YjbR family)
MRIDQALNKLRKICLGWPEVKETVTFGHPTFMAGKRTFAVLEPYKGEYAIAFKATPADQTALTMDPRFYITPYSGKHGWTSLRLSDNLDWHAVHDLLLMSYRLVALKRMIKALEQGANEKIQHHK